MIVKGTAVLQAGIRGEFIQAYQTGPTMVPRFCTVVPSNKDTENYAWLGEVTAIREWIGDRQLKGFTDTKYQLQNRLWEGSVGIKRTEIEDDQTSGIMTRARDLGTRARQHPDELLWTTLINNGNCYDGSAMFNAAHPAREPMSATGTQSNLLTGTGTTISAIQADAASAIASLKAVKDERGRPFWPVIDPKLLVAVCSPALEFNMRTVFQGTLISTTSNLLQGAVGDIFVNPWLATGMPNVVDQNDWYLFYLGGVIKPFVFQDRVSIELTDNLQDSEHGFMRDVFVFGSRARYNVGYGIWQAGVKIHN